MGGGVGLSTSAKIEWHKRSPYFKVGACGGVDEEKQKKDRGKKAAN